MDKANSCDFMIKCIYMPATLLLSVAFIMLAISLKNDFRNEKNLMVIHHDDDDYDFGDDDEK